MPGTLLAMTNAHGLARHIPEEVKRAIRRRCGFGCVVCGAALHEYHHFDPPFEEARLHRAEGIVLLCPTCHAHVTRGRWSNDKVVEANRSPFCRSNPPHERLEFAAPTLLLVGSILLNGRGDLLTIGGEPLIRVEPMEDGGLALSASILDENGEAVVRIEKNELVVCPPAWDVSMVGNKLRILRSRRECVLELLVHPPHCLHLTQLNLGYRGARLVSDARGRIDLSVDGKPCILLKRDHLMLIGGGLEITTTGVRIAGGFGAGPFPARRVAQLAKRGAVQDLESEFRDPVVHVLRPEGVDRWCIQCGLRKHPYASLEKAMSRARALCLLVPRLRGILHRSSGRLEFFPERT